MKGKRITEGKQLSGSEKTNAYHLIVLKISQNHLDIPIHFEYNDSSKLFFKRGRFL